MGDRLENLLGAVALGLTDAVSEAGAQASGLGGEGAAALVTLLAEPGIGVDRLARTLGISGSGAVRLVDRLVGAGLAGRARGSDGRAVSVILTEHGAGVAELVLAARERVLRDALADLGPRDRAVLERLLGRLLAGFTSDPVVGDRLCRLCDVRACPSATCPVELALC